MKLKINFPKVLNRAAQKALFRILTTTLLSMTAFVQSSDAQPTYTIGQSAQGGIVFYVDPSGLHGLVVADNDQSHGIQWKNGVDKSTGATADGTGAGLQNSMQIFDQQYNDNIAGDFAAKLCLDLVKDIDGQIYEDWYLPSKHELKLMSDNLYLAGIGRFSEDHSYWSSSEYDNNNAYVFFFLEEFSYKVTKSSSTVYVRAVRAF